MSIAQQLKEVLTRIQEACQKTGRPNNAVQLLAVSKTQSSQSVKEAFDAGQRDFGENYPQEGFEKITALSAVRQSIRWHLIGPLQSNKTKLVAEHFDWVQSVDRLKIAQRLNDQRPNNLVPLNVCVQINISEEASKSGVEESHALALCLEIAQLPRLCLRGLMAIPEPGSTEIPFTRMKSLFETIKHQLRQQGLGQSFDTLSLGMSDDLELAIAQGSTMVRIGTAIFGARQKSA